MDVQKKFAHPNFYDKILSGFGFVNRIMDRGPSRNKNKRKVIGECMVIKHGI